MIDQKYIACLLRFPGEENATALNRVSKHLTPDIESYILSKHKSVAGALIEWYGKDIALTPQVLKDITGISITQDGLTPGMTSVYRSKLEDIIAKERIKQASVKLAAGDVEAALDLAVTKTSAAEHTLPELISIGIDRYSTLYDTMRSPRVTFPWSDINNMAPLVMDDELIIYTGVTGTGKSSAALQTAVWNARRFPVLYFHNEDNDMKMMLRLIAQLQVMDDPLCTGSGVHYSSLLNNPLGNQGNVKQWSSRAMQTLDIDFVYCSGHTPEQIVSTWRRVRRSKTYKLVVIDYLNKMEISHLIKERGSVAYALDYVVELIKRECGHQQRPTPCILVQQDNDDGTTRDTRSAKIKGQLLIAFERNDDHNGLLTSGHIHVKKNNDGMTGRIPAEFYSPYMIWRG